MEDRRASSRRCGGETGHDPQHFRLEISFNETTGDAVAPYLQIRPGEVAETREIEKGVAFADYDPEGTLLGVELLAPCPLPVLDRLPPGEAPPPPRFLPRGRPHPL